MAWSKSRVPCSLSFVFACVLLVSCDPYILSDFLSTKLFFNRFYCDPDPDICRNATELITSKGYPAEDHTVQTEDGYLLGVQRIPYGIKYLKQASRPAVFLQHGLLSASTCWITNNANESLAFILADAGYDVWLGNVRGNTYSTKHVSLHPSQAQFWAWSWDEMAKYDIPAMLNYVLDATGQKQLYYVGHSQGTLVAMTQFSQDQQLAEKVKVFIGLGPVATTGSITSPLRYLTYIADPLQDLFYLFGIRDFLPNNDLIKILASSLCKEVVTREICENVMFLFGGSDAKNLNVSRLPVYIAHSPAGTSVQNVVHFAQMVKSGKCEMYDYGSSAANIKHYGQPYPPLYDLTKMKVPSYLFSADKDTLADPKDVHLLLSTLPNIKYHSEIEGWNHLDFIWATNANSLIYHQIIQIFHSNPLML